MTNPARVAVLGSLLRNKAEAFDLDHLTLVSSDGIFQAAYRKRDGKGYLIGVNRDPVEALIEALMPPSSGVDEEDII